MVFFEAPHRTADSLAAMAEVFGPDRPAAVCRELTKTYEEIVRGPLSELVEWAAAPVRGEVTLVVGGQPLVLTDLAGAVGQVLALTGQGTKLKPAVAEVAGRTGLAKNLLYDHALQAGRDRGGE